MEEPQNPKSSRSGQAPQTGARGDGVKTIHGCEDVFLDPPGGAVILFLENSSDLGHYFLSSRPEKSPFTHSLEAHDGGWHLTRGYIGAARMRIKRY